MLELILLCSCLRMDIIVVTDLSQSVSGNQQFIADATQLFVDRFELSEEGVRIGIVGFSSSAWSIAPLTNDKDTLAGSIAKIRRHFPEGSTDLGAGLYLALEQFLNEGRPDYQKVVILISDGDPDSQLYAVMAANQLKDIGIMILGVLVASPDQNTRFMAEISNYYLETDYKKLDICL